MNVLLELLELCEDRLHQLGGISMVPLINNEMISHGWMTAEEVTDILAIAEMTPGPNGYNCATFAGLRTAGIPGALAANLGVLLPAPHPGGPGGEGLRKLRKITGCSR